MLFGTKGFMKAMDKLTATKDNITDTQCAEAFGEAIDKACRANLIGGIGITVLASVVIKKLRCRCSQNIIEKYKDTYKKKT